VRNRWYALREGHAGKRLENGVQCSRASDEVLHEYLTKDAVVIAAFVRLVEEILEPLPVCGVRVASSRRLEHAFPLLASAARLVDFVRRLEMVIR